MKKLAIICGTLHSGGAERVISIISEKLAEKYDVEIILYYDREIWYKISDKVKITVVEKECRKKGTAARALWFRQYIKNNADIVLSFLAPFNIFTLVSLFGVKLPKIVADRNDPRSIPSNKMVRALRDFMYRFATAIVVQNDNNKKYFSKCVQKKSSVIFNPVAFQSYKGVALESEKDNKIVSVGRIIKQKNNMMLINAFKTICDDFKNAKLVFYGEGNLKESLGQKVAEMGLGERIIFAGNVKDVISNIKDAKMFVMTSDYEGMPNALLEAMCAGLPVISTKVSGAVDVIKSGENGILVDINDEEALATAMRSFLENEDYSRKCAENAVKVSSMLEQEVVIGQWVDLIEEVSSK